MHNKNFGHLVLLQTLYAWEFSPLTEREIIEVLHDSVEENAPQMSGVSILEEMIIDIIKKLSLIDSVIEKLIPERDVNNILIIDKNILRIAIYEMVFSDRNETPIHVAIKEATLLARSFSMQIGMKIIINALTALHAEVCVRSRTWSSRR